MQYQIAVTPKGHQVYRTVNGLYRKNEGPAWPTPREAIAYAEALQIVDDLQVDPLRSSVEGTPVSPSAPTGGASVVPSTESRHRDSRHEDSRQ